MGQVKLTSRFAGLLTVSLCLFVLMGCINSFHNQASQPELDSQNWSDNQKLKWYRGSQGSRLIPAKWLHALEAPDSTTRFMDPAHFSRFNYLPAELAPSQMLPQSKSCAGSDVFGKTLPIGFAIDCGPDKELLVTRRRWYKGQTDKEAWVGLNCAACHTNRIEVGDKTIVVDGAPTMADFQGFTGSLLKSMEQTLADSQKWSRFSAKVVAPRKPKEHDDTRADADRAGLLREFKLLLKHTKDLQAFNKTGSEYGHARLDAVGHILNKVAYLNSDANPIRGEPDAPVSYPFIWNAGQHDKVQWNGIVPQKSIKLGADDLEVGALIRNTSEVIGVFADVRLRKNAGLNGYNSSVDLKNLVAMEDQLGKLWSPKWPGPIDVALMQEGRKLFGDKCESCHAELVRSDMKSPIKAVMTPIWGDGGLGTDPWMACNAFAYMARGGLLVGTKENLVAGKRLGDLEATNAYLQTQAVGVLLGKKWMLLVIAVKKAIGLESGIETYGPESVVTITPGEQPMKTDVERLAYCQSVATSSATAKKDRDLLAYKGRPLNGIWATAPYLHNGSVPTLYDLLRQPSERPTRFWVGNPRLDVDKVGFLSVPNGPGTWFEVKDANGKEIKGNSNLGHNYGELKPPEILSLVEYMKSL